MHLLDHLAKPAILAAYAKSQGRELDGKGDSPESSAALVANAFGYFIYRPVERPPLPGMAFAGRPAAKVQLEANVRFPWTGGMHPWLDVLVETNRRPCSRPARPAGRMHCPHRAGILSIRRWRKVVDYYDPHQSDCPSL